MLAGQLHDPTAGAAADIIRSYRRLTASRRYDQAILAAAALYVIASGKAGVDLGGFAANGYGEHSPGGYSLAAALVIELVLTFFFLMIILGAILLGITMSVLGPVYDIITRLPL